MSTRYDFPKVNVVSHLYFFLPFICCYISLIIIFVIVLGVIIGKGWDTAPNISDEFRRIAVGSIPYQHLPKVHSDLL